MNTRDIVENASSGALIALDGASPEMTTLVAKMVAAVGEVVSEEKGFQVAEAIIRTAALVSMAVSNPGREPHVLQYSAQMLMRFACLQVQRSLAMPAGVTVQ